jgi:hypothetical protein
VNLFTPDYVYIGISVSAERTAVFRELKVWFEMEPSLRERLNIWWVLGIVAILVIAAIVITVVATSGGGGY